MLTVRGSAGLGAAAALIVLWIVFGELELFGVGLFLGVATVLAWWGVRRLRPTAAVSRRVTPVQLYEGDRATVELAIQAGKRLRRAVVEDEVQGLGTARHGIGTVPEGMTVLARYEILCRPRGIYRIGPAQVVVTDALGLAENRTALGPVDRLVVYPGVEDLSGFPLLRGQDPSVQSAQPTFAPHGGEDFFTLREYRHGDDLRRVHWPSSAKRDELMIRQLEIPWQSRALILLDTRPYDSEVAFEKGVQGAASVLHHFTAGGFAPELWVGAEPSPTGGNRYTEAMERLAAVQPAEMDLRAAVARLRRRGQAGGALVLVSGRVDEQHLVAYQTLSRDYARTILMMVGDEPLDTLALHHGGAAVVAIGPEEDWATAWSEAMRSTWPSASAG